MTSNSNDKNEYQETLVWAYPLLLLDDNNEVSCEIVDIATCDLRLINEDIPSDDGIVYTKEELNDALYTCFYEIGPQGGDPDATAAVSVLFNRLTMIYKARKYLAEKQSAVDQANSNYQANQQQITAGQPWNRPGDKEKYEQLQREAQTLRAANRNASTPRDTARDLKTAMESYADNSASEVITLSNLCNPNQFSRSLQEGKKRKQQYCNGDQAEKVEGNKRAWNAVRKALITLARSKASRNKYVILRSANRPIDGDSNVAWTTIGGNIYHPLPSFSSIRDDAKKKAVQNLFTTLMNDTGSVRRGNR